MKWIACFLLPVFILPVIVSAQKIDAALAEMAAKHPAEKIYIQYDKDYYTAGETVWFKAYLYNNGQPSVSSYNFYLQLSDNTGNVVARLKYPVKGATVAGSISLPDTLAQGTYFVKALTPAMLNEDPDLHYLKPLYIINPYAGNKTIANPDTATSLSLRFFPEGGNLTEDILSVVAFKATRGNGRPVDISGVIKTDDTVAVTSFTSMHDGIGKFQFKPRPGKKYTAMVTINGLTAFYPLPAAQPSGIGIKLENEKGGKVFTISRTRKDKDQFDKVRLLAQMNNRVMYDEEIAFDNFFQVKGHLITDSMPSGILHFTLFNKEGMPMAERLAFVNNREYESAGNVAVVKQGTDKRAENIIDISFAEPAQRSLSISVTDPAVSSLAGENTIVSTLLLTSDLRGIIHNPAWYFQPGNDSLKEQALDNLVMTHGWVRFNWSKILAGKFPEKKINDQYLIAVPGLVKDSKTKKPLSDGMLSVFLESADSVNQHFDIPVDANGSFTIDSLLIRGSTKIFYAYTSKQGDEKTADIFLYTIPADSAVAAMSVNQQDAAELSGYYSSLFSNRELNITLPVKKSKLEETKELDPVTLKPNVYKRPIDEVNAKYTSGVFTTMGRSNFDNINQPENDRSLSVYDFTKRSVTQIIEQDGEFVNRRNFDLFENPTPDQMIKYAKTKDSLQIINAGNGADPNDYYSKINYKKGKHFVVGVYLNENPVYIGILRTIRMDEVALIKFYEPGFIGSGATESGGGVLAVYTKKLVVPEGRLEKLDHIVYKGYTMVKEFYSPDYATASPSAAVEDNRTTLYWNPELYTGSSNNTVRLKFFNNDRSKKFKLIVEGFDGNGKLVHLEKLTGE